MSQQTTSPLDLHRTQIEELISTGSTYAEVVAWCDSHDVTTSRRSIGRALDRWGVPRPGVQTVLPGLEVKGDKASATSKASVTLDYSDPDSLLKERGLEPDEWEVQSLTVNEWDSPTGEIMKQLKVGCRRKKPLHIPMAAQLDLDLPKPKVKKKTTTPKMVVCVGDQQAPYHNPRLHSLFQEFLSANQPDEGVLIGDTIDVPVISRHPAEPQWAATTQECVNAAGQIIYDYRIASPDTAWTKLAGNHDERLRRAVINQLADYYGLQPAQVADLPEHPPIHSPRNLLRLDELGVAYEEPKGSYEHAQVRLSRYLAARHGWIARKNSGASAHATLDHLGHSIIVGHTHRQSRVHQTKFSINGQANVITAVETGCMCLIEDGLGYAVAPDWQNGFAVATVWTDGTFSIDLATYVDGVLLYRDQRYS